MAVRPILSRFARLTSYGLGGTAIVGCSAVTAYTYTDQGLGFRREIRFWSQVAPVVFDYWWHISSSSPLVKFQKQFRPRPILQADDENSDKHDSEKHLDEIGDYVSDDRKAVFKRLHERNAPKIFSIMLELGGLYIKLGQVLSVTALPVPTEYRNLFRTLQSNVPGHEEFENVIKPTLETAFGVPLHELFESIDEIPCGAASIGQAHKAKLKKIVSENDHDEGNITDVVIKVQYPDAKWQVPADVQCVGDFLDVCVYFGVVDESSAKLSYEEFSRQFLAELDYLREAKNLQEVHKSSLDPKAPYMKRGVEIPKVFPELCTDQVITMTYLPGPKFEQKAREQLKSLGIDTERGVHSVVQEDTAKDDKGTTTHVKDSDITDESNEKSRKSFRSLLSVSEQSKHRWIVKVAEHVGAIVGVDNILFLVQLVRQTLLWSTAIAVRSIQLASRTTPSIIPLSQQWLKWAKDHENAASQAEMLDWTSDAIDALFDVHGYQIFNQGLFNADAHPGNILIIERITESSNDKHNKSRNKNRPKLGLIDFGQCKRLNEEERQRIARLVISVANEESDEQVALHCRNLGFVTKNDSTKFLSTFARLMFGKFRSEHLKPSWHKSLHDEDEIVYFPSELSMVYRTSLLLRGLAMSFQLNVSVGEKWREHAQSTLNQFNK